MYIRGYEYIQVAGIHVIGGSYGEFRMVFWIWVYVQYMVYERRGISTDRRETNQEYISCSVQYREREASKHEEMQNCAWAMYIMDI